MSGDFKHITVSAAEDDDVVVWAGEKRVQDEPHDNRAPSGIAPDDAESDLVGSRVPESAESEPKDPAPAEDFQTDQETPESAAALNRPSQRPQKKAGDGYQATTLEDLERQPMSATQRAVIIAAVVCIIGAIVYYFVAMG